MLLTSQQLEEKENILLAPYAVRSLNSRGREFEEKKSDHRTCFQRDRDRVIHCRSFRRLKGKTQVFVAGGGDHFRTRLTHSLEVAQVARDISRAMGLNEDLAEVIALAHDLGHTPFAHAGQEAMHEMMQKYGLSYEHNDQSRRIVEYLENVYPDFRGLNLSFEVREGLMKHQTSYDNHGKTFEIHPSLEAQIVDIADEIAYNSHDIDDGINADILRLTDLEEIPIWNEAIKRVKDEYGVLEFGKIYNARTVSKVMTLMIDDVLKQSELNISNAKISSLEDVYASKVKLIAFSDVMQKKLFILKKFLYTKFYYHPKIRKLSEEGEQTIKKLFEYYEQNINKLPYHFQKDIYDENSKAIAIKDYIAGMTDEFAKEILRQIS